MRRATSTDLHNNETFVLCARAMSGKFRRWRTQMWKSGSRTWWSALPRSRGCRKSIRATNESAREYIRGGIRVLTLRSGMFTLLEVFNSNVCVLCVNYIHFNYLFATRKLKMNRTFKSTKKSSWFAKFHLHFLILNLYWLYVLLMATGNSVL